MFTKERGSGARRLINTDPSPWEKLLGIACRPSGWGEYLFSRDTSPEVPSFLAGNESPPQSQPWTQAVTARGTPCPCAAQRSSSQELWRGRMGKPGRLRRPLVPPSQTRRLTYSWGGGCRRGVLMSPLGRAESRKLVTALLQPSCQDCLAAFWGRGVEASSNSNLEWKLREGMVRPHIRSSNFLPVSLHKQRWFAHPDGQAWLKFSQTRSQPQNRRLCREAGRLKWGFHWDLLTVHCFLPLFVSWAVHI